MADNFNLARFIDAQADIYDTVLAELTRGQKVSHWMWFIFPQLAELGRSERALFYGIHSLDEARAYIDHPLLGPRLRECTGIMNAVRGRTAREILGQIDELKFRSCVTLFSRVSTDSVFAGALDKYFSGEPDPQTLAALAKDAS